jgi:hypothetical protein
MFRAQPVVACITFHTLIAIDGGALDYRVHVDCSHGTDIGAIATGHAFVRIYFHNFA